MKKVLVCVLLLGAAILAHSSALAVGATPEPDAFGVGAGQASSASPSAEVSELPTVHILPDSPLYFLKTIKENTQLLVTRSDAGQADLVLKFAQKRLAEALKVAEKGKIHISEKLLDAFGKDVETAQQKIREARARGEKTYNLLVELQKTIIYQKSVIEKLQGEVDFYSSGVGERIEALNSFLVEIDQDLGDSYTEATKSGKISAKDRSEGLNIFDWLKGLFGKRKILSPIAE